MSKAKIKKRPSTSLRREFLNLPDEYEREYEQALTKKVNMMEVSEKELIETIRYFNDFWQTCTCERQKGEEKIAYAALYCLGILYRHSLDSVKFQKVADECSSWCRSHKTFRFLEITLQSNHPTELRGQEETYLKDLHRYMEEYPKNSGYAHGLANLYANICEYNIAKKEHFHREWHEKAREAVDFAISMDPNYALYYCTKGRIALISGYYDEADALFETAIQMENSAEDGYAIRISRYLSYRSQVQVQRTIAQAQEHVAQAQEQIDAIKAANISNIEVLAFFSGVVAFIIGSLSFVNGQTAANAAVLIAVLMGALISTFAVFSFLLNLNTQQNKKIRIANIIIGIVGVIIVIGGIWFVSSH